MIADRESQLASCQADLAAPTKRLAEVIPIERGVDGSPSVGLLTGEEIQGSVAGCWSPLNGSGSGTAGSSGPAIPGEARRCIWAAKQATPSPATSGPTKS